MNKYEEVQELKILLNSLMFAAYQIKEENIVSIFDYVGDVYIKSRLLENMLERFELNVIADFCESNNITLNHGDTCKEVALIFAKRIVDTVNEDEEEGQA